MNYKRRSVRLAVTVVASATAATEPPAKAAGARQRAITADAGRHAFHSAGRAGFAGCAPGVMPPEQGSQPAPKKATVPEKLVDLNNASLAVLKKDLSVGDAVARKIIAARPYAARPTWS